MNKHRIALGCAGLSVLAVQGLTADGGDIETHYLPGSSARLMIHWVPEVAIPEMSLSTQIDPGEWDGMCASACEAANWGAANSPRGAKWSGAGSPGITNEPDLCQDSACFAYACTQAGVDPYYTNCVNNPASFFGDPASQHFGYLSIPCQCAIS